LQTPQERYTSDDGERRFDQVADGARFKDGLRGFDLRAEAVHRGNGRVHLQRSLARRDQDRLLQTVDRVQERSLLIEVGEVGAAQGGG